MNLEELKIKISIELKELDKQLNSISKSIDKTLGSKATKKLMQSNHKVIKAESKLINKTLNDAFEVDFTKFNNGLAKTMNQAKRTVQQTCREIRNELNNALNGSGSITVTGKASVSRTSSSQNSANNAAIVQSSQYVGAMITKAVNEMIKANNANTGRIETALKEVINAIGKLSINNNKQKNLRESDNTAQGKGGQTKTTNTVELIFDVKDSELQNEVDQAINRINVPNLEIPIDVDTSDIDKKIDVSNVSTVVSLEVDIDDSELQSKVEKAKNKISVPDVRIGTMLDDRNNIQNEVNKLVRETNVPELKVSFASIEEDGEKLQSTIYHIMKEMEVPELKIPFASINVKELESNINKAIKDIKVSQVEIPTSITKAESNTTESTTKIKRKPTPIVENEAVKDIKVSQIDLGEYGEDRLKAFYDLIEKNKNKVKSLIQDIIDLRKADISIDDKTEGLEEIAKKANDAEKYIFLLVKRQEMLEKNFGIDTSGAIKELERYKDYIAYVIKDIDKLRNSFNRIRGFNELSITIDDDGSISHIFENLSEALTKAAEESSKKINKIVSELKGMDSIDLGDAPQNTDTSSLEEAVRLESEITREQSKQQGVRKSIENTLDTIKNDLEQIRDVSGIELDIDFSSKYFADSIKHLRDGLIEIKELGFEDSVELPDGTIFDSNT